MRQDSSNPLDLSRRLVLIRNLQDATASAEKLIEMRTMAGQLDPDKVSDLERIACLAEQAVYALFRSSPTLRQLMDEDADLPPWYQVGDGDDLEAERDRLRYVLNLLIGRVVALEAIEAGMATKAVETVQGNLETAS